MTLAFELTRQFGQSNEKVIAKFSEEKDAREFMIVKANWDNKTKVQTIYRLYHFGEVIDEMKSGDADSGGTASAGTGSAFSPSPFSTTPQPLGAKSSYLNKDPKDEEI